MSTRGVAVEIAHVSKSYGRVVALDDMSLSIRPGEFVTLLGPSGSGKTTLLMILGGFVRPTTGDITFDGRAVVRLPPHKRNIGVVFQSYALFPNMDVAANVAFPLRLRRLPAPEIARRVAAALDLVRLGGYGARQVHELSGGQSQRVALARAIVFEPDILLMDEPLSALDKKLREQMQVEIRRLHDALGLTTIYVTHDQREALTMSDRVAVIAGGRLRQFAAPRELYERPADAFVADFVGESTLLPVARMGAGVALQGQALRHDGPVPDAAALVLVLRPEKLTFAAPGANADDINHLPGTLRGIVFQGETVLYQVALGDGGEVTVRDLSRNEPQHAGLFPGAAVTVALHRRDTLVLPA
ncbi:ABC transporter ATP-binding protein [Limobrevibacterium gyesilva]|nr:ABC transporter ATP-binding protein [Limobrevibacterium gyesilva]